MKQDGATAEDRQIRLHLVGQCFAGNLGPIELFLGGFQRWPWGVEDKAGRGSVWLAVR